MWAKLLALLMPIVETEVTAVAPIAVNAVSKLGAAELQAVQSGNLKDTGKILADTVNSAAADAAAAGISAGAPALLVAVSHAIASAPAPAAS